MQTLKLLFPLENLFEDEDDVGKLYFDMCIRRIAETLLYSKRLYSEFKVPSVGRISIVNIRAG